MKKWQENILFFGIFALTCIFALATGFLFRNVEFVFLSYPLFLVFALHLFDKFFSSREFSKWLSVFSIFIILLPSVFLTISVGTKPICDAKYGPDYDCYVHARDYGWNVVLGVIFIFISLFVFFISKFHSLLIMKKQQWGVWRRTGVTLVVAYALPIVISAILMILFF